MRIREVPARTIHERVNHVIGMIQQGRYDVNMRQLAAQLVKAVPAKDWLGEIRSVWDFAKGNIRYTLDPYEKDLFQRASRTLQLGIGDCDDMTIVLGALLQNIGYPMAIKIVDTTGTGWNHIYPLVGVPPTNPRKWIPLDLAAIDKPMGWEVPAEAVKRQKVFRI